MNVFIVGSPLETAQALDRKRLNKQIIECQQILKSIYGVSKAWKNHPCTVQYKQNRDWLIYYMLTLSSYFSNDLEAAEKASAEAMKIQPSFHTEPYFNSMKRRLYTKDPVHYAQWADLGISEVNWYWSPVEDTYIYYSNGKRVKP